MHGGVSKEITRRNQQLHRSPFVIVEMISLEKTDRRSHGLERESSPSVSWLVERVSLIFYGLQEKHGLSRGKRPGRAEDAGLYAWGGGGFEDSWGMNTQKEKMESRKLIKTGTTPGWTY